MPTRKAIRLSSASPIVRSWTRSWNCAAARTASTALRKFGQEPVASVFYDPAAMLGDRRLDSVRQEHGQTGVRRLFVYGA